ncbi:MAG TPA: hypothetical protein DCY50_10455 [Franconibacter helveticus]|nr:hypothetical protein [Franconibacter helveticus]
MNCRFFFVKRRFNLFYCYLFRRHSINNGNVIRVETLFWKFEAGRVLRRQQKSAPAFLTRETVKKQNARGLYGASLFCPQKFCH